MYFFVVAEGVKTTLEEKYSAQLLRRHCTEIEWYKVKGNPIRIMIVWKCRLDYFVVFVGEIPDFGFQITKYNIKKLMKSSVIIHLIG